MERSGPSKPENEIMSVSEPDGGQVAEEVPPADQVTLSVSRTQRRRRWRQVFVVALAVTALLCLGGVGAGFLLYDRETKPDLGTPAVSTRQYLAAYLVDRDDGRAALLQCSNSAGLADLRSLRDDLDTRQKTYGITFAVAIDSVRELSRSSNEARVGADINISAIVQGKPQRALEHWEFITQNEDGWRVCGGHEVT
jgi:hypothetical protein